MKPPSVIKAKPGRALLRAALLLSLGASAVACGGGAAVPAHDGAAAGSGGGVTSSAGADAAAGGTGSAGATGEAGTDGAAGADAPPACGPRATYGGGEISLPSAMAVAVIVDETGAPVSGAPAMICGINICTAPEKTGADGRLTIPSSALGFKAPAFRYGDGIAYAELAVPLSAPANDFTAGGHVLATGKLSDKPGAVLTPGTVAASGNVSLAIAAGATVGIDTLNYDTPETQMLRAVSIPLANLGPALASAKPGGVAADFRLVYGVTPASTTFCPAAKVTVRLPHATTQPNDLGWAPGAAVEFWITSPETEQQFAPFAGWAKMSDGIVSADGTSASTRDGAGQGFVDLETFAIRRAP